MVCIAVCDVDTRGCDVHTHGCDVDRHGCDVHTRGRDVDGCVIWMGGVYSFGFVY